MQKDNKPDTLDTKEKILRGSANLFSERGYFGVSMDEIALNIGISKATLYYHFESKESILNILVTDACTELKSELSATIDKSKLPSDYVLNIVLTILNFRLKHPEITLLNSFGFSTDSKVPALQFMVETRTELMKFIRDLLTGTNIFRKFTYNVMQVVIVNILSFTLNPFMEVKKNNENTAERFTKLINV